MAIIYNFDRGNTVSNDRIKTIFEEAINNSKELRRKYKDDDFYVLDDLDYLEGYVSDLLVKIKDKNWKISKLQDQFLKHYEEYDFNKEYSDEEWNTFFLLELIYLSDINPTLLYEEYYYIDLVVNSINSNFDEFGIDNKDMISKIINNVRKPAVKRLFHTEEEESYKMDDVVDGIIHDTDLLTIISWFKNTTLDSSDEDDLDNGILTFDRVFDYYQEQEELLDLNRFKDYRNNNIDEYEESIHTHNQIILSNILKFKKYSENSKFNYLELIKVIHRKHNIDEELIDVINLTSLYMQMGNQIDEFDIEDLEHYLKIGGKNENRRF